MSNIGLVLSPTVLDRTSGLDDLGMVHDIHLYRVTSRMGCCWQVPFPEGHAAREVDIADPRAQGRKAAKLADLGDDVTIAVQAGTPSLLILSQKFHRDWHAQTLTPNGWQPAAVVAVNGVFQGVKVPQDVTQVRLRFLPFARFAWIAHAFWLVVLVALVMMHARARMKLFLANKGTP